MTTIVTTDPKEYGEAVISFMNGIEPYKVRSIVMVAILEDQDLHDVYAGWNAGPFELMGAAGVLQLNASMEYNSMNEEEDDEYYSD